MKICHVTWTLCYGGIETMLVNIANEQARLGHEVHIVVVNDLSQELVKNILPQVRFHHLARPLGSHNPWHIIKLNHWLSQIGADVIHLHSVNLLKYISARFVGTKICATHHTTYLPGDDKWLRRIPVLFTISGAAAESIESNIGRRAIVVENGIVTKSFRVKTDYDSCGRTFRLIQVGRMIPQYKGQDILLRALRSLLDDGLNVSVDFFGGGPKLQELKDLATHLGVASSCHFHGAASMDIIARSLADYDLLVQPSRREGFGLTLVEAMVAGVPVLASDLPAMRDILEDGRLGMLFESENSDDCAKAVKVAMASDFTAVAKVARNKVCELYDVATTAARYVAEYQKI